MKPSTRQRVADRDEAIAQLVYHAQRLFFEKGFSATTMQDLADAYGVQKGSLYQHIGSKEEVLYLVILEAIDGYEERLQRYSGLDSSAVDLAVMFVEDHVKNSIANRISVGVFNRDFRHLGPRYRDEVVRIRDRYDSFLRTTLEQGKHDGTIAEEIDAFLTATAIMGMINGIPLWYDPKGELTQDEIAHSYGSIVRRIVSR